jgi:autotransporter-associated beta strand protein
VLAKTNSGTLVLTGNNTYSGGTTISAGTLQVGNGATSGTLDGGPVTNNASLVFNRSDTLGVPSITGSGTLTKNGTGNVVLTGANSYSGGTNVSQGALTYLTRAAQPTSGTTTVAAGATLGLGVGATPTYFGAADLDALFAGTMPNVSNGPNSNVGIFPAAGNFTYASNIPLTTRGLTMLGGSPLTLTGTNSYTGGTSVSQGFLTYLTRAAQPTSGTTTVAPGATLGLGVGATPTYYGTADLDALFAGTMPDVNNGPNSNVGIDTTVGSFTYASNIPSTTRGLTKLGPNTLTLTGANSYSGLTTVLTPGVLQIGNGSTVGTLGIGVVTGNGALVFNRSDTLTVGNGIIGAVNLTQAGTGTLILTGTNSYSGSTTITAGTLQVGNGGTSGWLGTGPVVDNASLVFKRSDTVTVGNLISGTGSLTQAGTGALIVTNNNSYSGGTTISAGTLVVGNGGNTGTLDGGPVTDNASLVFNRSDSVTVSYIISGTGRLTQAGIGTLILTGTNTYSGGTTISAGTLQVGNGGTTGTLDGGPVTDNASLVFNRSDSVTVSYIISGSGSLTQAGTGTLVLTGTNAYTGGTTTINGGTLEVIGSLLGSSTVTADTGGTLTLSDNGQLGAGIENVGLSGTGTFTQSGGANSNYQLNVGVNSGSSGTYSLSGGQVWASYENVGLSGTGTFTQSDGNNSVSSVLNLGYNAGGSGTYNQSGGTTSSGSNINLGMNAGAIGTYNLSGGQVWAPYQNVGWSGTGTFTQSGGTNTSGSNINLGLRAGASGTYDLSGGQVSAVYENVAWSGTGTFTQSGGTNSASNLNLGFATGSNGTYNLSGGELVAAFENVGNSGTGTFTQSGGTNSMMNNNNNQLNVGVSAGSNGTYSLSGGQVLVPYENVGSSGTGVFTQSDGTNSVKFNLNLGYNAGSSGTFNQSGGTTSTGDGYNINLGVLAGSSGAYNLSGSGQVSADYELVGFSGTGTFTQTGGTNTARSILDLGFNPGSSGTYNQSGGTNNGGNYLQLGIYAGSTGTYNLSGNGQLAAGTENVGYSGTGTFTQSGGTNSVSSVLNLGNNAGSSGTYNLNGGVLILSSLSQGSGSAAFNFNGGTLQASSTFSTSLPMTLGTSGGGATFDTAGYDVALSGALSGPGSLTKLGTGTLTLTGSSGPVTVIGGGIRPGPQGALSTGNLDIQSSGSYDAVAFNSPGQPHRQIDVTGTVRLEGALDLSASTPLPPGFAPSPGDSFTLISNDGADPVSGVFSNYPSNGQLVVVDGLPFYLYYNGGDGNDVVLIANRVPTANAAGPYTVFEGGTVALDASASTDPDQDPATLVYAWDFDGDGAYDDATGITPVFSAALLDGPTTVTVGLKVTDSFGLSGTGAATVMVVNVAPTATLNDYATTQAAAVGGNVITDDTGHGADSDPAGTHDPLTIVDADPETPGVQPTSGPMNGTLLLNSDGSFTYTPDTTFSGADSFTYTISDGDGGTATATVTITVAAAAPGSILTVPDTCLGGTALLITGTGADDTIVVAPGAMPSTVTVIFNGVVTTQPQPGGRIIVCGGNGNDDIQIAGAITNIAWLYGDAGNDRLNAGNGGSLLVGGDGNDQLLGGSGRDVMVGGEGADRLIGNSSDDILIAALTTMDSRSVAGHEGFWCSLLSQWRNGDSFDARVGSLRPQLLAKVVDDLFADEVDFLNGSAGDDWLIFTVGEDKVAGQQEAIN